MGMFKSLAAPVAIIAFAAVAGAAIMNLQDVNTKVAAITAPFNTPTTTMSFAFTSLNVDAVRALDFGFTGSVTKVGANNRASLTFSKAQYTYGDGSKPTFDVDATVGINLVTAFGQKMINEIAGQLDSFAVDMAQEYTKDFGPAMAFKATVDEKKLDAAGNVEAVQMTIRAAIDSSLLPATMPTSEVQFQTIDATISASATAGINISFKLVANPLYKGFQADGEGMKELVEKLVADDATMYNDLQRYLAMFDSLAGMLVDMKP